MSSKELHRKPTSEIKNKAKKWEVHRRRVEEKRKLQSSARLERKKALQELGTPLPVPQSIESKRIRTEDDVGDDAGAADEELQGDERDDEFAPFWNCEKEPKVFLTTRPRPSKHLFKFISDLMAMIPHVFYHPRKSRELTEMSQWALEHGFTHMIVLGEKNKTPHRLTLSLLQKGGSGPTCLFKLSSIELIKNIKGHGASTDHLPELVLNNFTTRTGHRVGRFFGSLFPQTPEFLGRTVVTFHNQRDFIFVRHHRYEFTPQMTRAHLQELGPRFTLKLKSMSVGGAMDRQHSEIEFSRQKGEEKVKKGTKDGREFVM